MTRVIGPWHKVQIGQHYSVRCYSWTWSRQGVTLNRKLASYTPLTAPGQNQCPRSYPVASAELHKVLSIRVPQTSQMQIFMQCSVDSSYMWSFQLAV